MDGDQYGHFPGAKKRSSFDRVGQLDTTRLEGLRAQITLTHYQGAGYAKPFVRIVGLRAIGDSHHGEREQLENGDLQR